MSARITPEEREALALEFCKNASADELERIVANEKRRDERRGPLVELWDREMKAEEQRRARDLDTYMYGQPGTLFGLDRSRGSVRLNGEPLARRPFWSRLRDAYLAAVYAWKWGWP